MTYQHFMKPHRVMTSRRMMTPKLSPGPLCTGRTRRMKRRRERPRSNLPAGVDTNPKIANLLHEVRVVLY